MSQNKTQPPKYKREKRVPKKITPQYLHNAGLYYLGRFAASSSRFRDVMMRRIRKSCAYHTDQNQEDCLKMLEDVIATFKRSGLLNDALYAQGLAQSLRSRGISKTMVLQKMSDRGIGKTEAEKILYDLDSESEDAEFSAALRYARRKKIGHYTTKNIDKNNYEKQLAAMARAGFSYNVAQRALSHKPDQDET